MSLLVIPCEIGEVSDGFHTFNELYEHRNLLLLLAMKLRPGIAWASRLHSNGSKIDGWFICGVKLPTGDITYHLPERLWQSAVMTGAVTFEKAPAWDGQTPGDCLKRLSDFILQG